MAIASVLLLTALVFPIWKINLEAPQYPEGLGLYIWAHQITGVNSNDLNTLNALNHYIGMKTIEPDAIPELTYMPYIIIIMTLLGLAAAFSARRKMILGWIIILIVTGIIGLYDFYAWGYDYGHDLNPNAPIKVPGLTYQPPLIGSKQLLNINAFSFPYTGSFGIGAAILLAAFIYIRSGKHKGQKGTLAIIPVLMSSALLAGCGAKGPVDIEYGKVNCAHCEMTVMDKKFGSEMITDKGKIYYFDSIECLIEYGRENEAVFENAQKYVTGFDSPEKLLPADAAVYFQSSEVRSPMGGSIAAFSERAGIDKFFLASSGETLEWDKAMKAEF